MSSGGGVAVAFVSFVVVMTACSKDEPAARGEHACDPLSDSNARVMYAATTAGGQRFYAFEPATRTPESRVRAFYGTPERMAERRLLFETRSSAVHLEIDLEGVRTMAVLTFCNSAGAFGSPRLLPGSGLAIALTPIPGSPGGVTCPRRDLLTDAGDDGGVDGGVDSGAPIVRVDDATLTSGVQFFCL